MIRIEYKGPLRAVIFDWAGTTVDFGCHAPALVLRELFAQHDVPVTTEEVRRDMGLPKKDHIRAICALARVRSTWMERHGSEINKAAVDKLFAQFAPKQIQRLAESSDVIEGVPEVVTELRAKGLRIGSTTGYTREMLDIVMKHAARQGYAPDVSVTPDEANGGRPEPWMCYLNLIRLGVFPPQACVKVGDTPADMVEGRNAGMWTVGVVDSSNEIGMTHKEWNGLIQSEREKLRIPVREKFQAAGAHFVIDTLGHLERVMQDIARGRTGS